MCPAGYPGSWTTFSAVPVLPAIGIGKLENTPDDVPNVECAAE